MQRDPSIQWQALDAELAHTAGLAAVGLCRVDYNAQHGCGCLAQQAGRLQLTVATVHTTGWHAAMACGRHETATYAHCTTAAAAAAAAAAPAAVSSASSGSTGPSFWRSTSMTPMPAAEAVGRGTRA